MTRELLIPIARDVVEHAKAGTIKQAKEVMRLPATHYTDSSRFNTEVERLIKRVPIVLGPSCEIPNSGDFKTLSIAGMSLIVSRADDGKAHCRMRRPGVDGSSPCEARLVRRRSGVSRRYRAVRIYPYRRRRRLRRSAASSART